MNQFMDTKGIILFLVEISKDFHYVSEQVIHPSYNFIKADVYEQRIPAHQGIQDINKTYSLYKNIYDFKVKLNRAL